MRQLASLGLKRKKNTFLYQQPMSRKNCLRDSSETSGGVRGMSLKFCALREKGNSHSANTSIWCVYQRPEDYPHYLLLETK